MYEELDKNANLGAFSTLDMEVFVPEVEKLKLGQTYLEIGVDKGKSLSIARMVAEEDVNVYGIDLQSGPAVEGTIFIQGDSREIKIPRKVDVLFVDGDHSYEGCKADIDNWYPQMAENGVMLFHDADETSPGVVKAIKEFVKEKGLDVYFHPDQRCSMARIRL